MCFAYRDGEEEPFYQTRLVKFCVFVCFGPAFFSCWVFILYQVSDFECCGCLVEIGV